MRAGHRLVLTRSFARVAVTNVALRWYFERKAHLAAFKRRHIKAHKGSGNAPARVPDERSECVREADAIDFGTTGDDDAGIIGADGVSIGVDQWGNVI